MRRASYQVETYNNKERRRISGERRGQRRCSQRLNLFTPQAEGSSSDNVAYASWSIFLEGGLGVFVRRVLLEVGEEKSKKRSGLFSPESLSFGSYFVFFTTRMLREKGSYFTDVKSRGWGQ